MAEYTHDYKIGIYYFPAKHATLMSQRLRFRVMYSSGGTCKPAECEPAL